MMSLLFIYMKFAIKGTHSALRAFSRSRSFTQVPVQSSVSGNSHVILKMRLILPLIFVALCLAFAYTAVLDAAGDDQAAALLQLADQGGAHENQGAREARGGGSYGGYGGYGGYGRGGYGGYGRGGYGGYGRGGYGGYGGYGRGGYGGYGRGGYGGYGRGGYGRGGWGR